MKSVLAGLFTLIVAQPSSAADFKWKDAPPNVQEVAKRLTPGKPNKDTLKGLPGVKMINVSIGGLDIFLPRSKHREDIAEDRVFTSTSQIDIHYIEGCRKVFWSKTGPNRDDGGRVRILVIKPGTKAKGEDGAEGFPLVLANWEFGPGEKLGDGGAHDYGNVTVIIYPTHIEPGKTCRLYRHLEWE